MKFKSNTITCFFLLSCISALTQVNDRSTSKVPFIDAKEILKITLKSDSSTKSVLVSNLKEDKAGDMSPVIGAAVWMDGGKELQCRSLLEFDFNLLPVEIRNNPLLILEADLVLYPIDAEFAVHDNEKPSVIYIREVLDKWEDSSTMWNNQPNVSSENQASGTIEAKNKNIPTSIDVTDLVLINIFKGRNNGFMIGYDENRNQSFTAGQLFASPKHENPAIRPQLILYIKVPKDKEYTNGTNSIKPVDVKDLDYYRKWQIERDLWIRQHGEYHVNLAAPQSVLPQRSKVVEN